MDQARLTKSASTGKSTALFAQGLVGPSAHTRAGVPLKSILLVDDSKFMRMANEKALARAGYEVITASDGEEALRMAQARIPDLILLDMLLPKLGGPQVLQALKKNPLTLSIPVCCLEQSSPEKRG